MASGKTSLGKKIAKKLGLDFLDTDQFIEEKYNCSISELIEKEGEMSFREIEKSILPILLEKKNVVIATGGGFPCFGDNMALLLANGIVVFLSISAQNVLIRLNQNDRKACLSRPLLREKSPSELKDFIENLLSSRQPIYEKAHIELSATNISMNALIKQIEELQEK